MTPEQALAILRFAVPGFIFLKLIYFLGLRTTRTNLEWTIWSLVASVPIAALATAWHPEDDWARDAWAAGIALAAGLVAGLVWGAITDRAQGLRESLHATAWDAVLSQPCWVEVETADGDRWMGKTAVTAESGATDKVDLYLRSPAQHVATSDEFFDRNDLDGILIAAERIKSVRVYADQATLDKLKAAADPAPVPDA